MNVTRAKSAPCAWPAGAVWINYFLRARAGAPFGRSRDCGIGREGGNWSFEFFCDESNVTTLR